MPPTTIHKSESRAAHRKSRFRQLTQVLGGKMKTYLNILPRLVIACGVMSFPFKLLAETADHVCPLTNAPVSEIKIDDTVHFKSRDNKIELIGYLFKPIKINKNPAIVMLHGRSGPYTTGSYSEESKGFDPRGHDLSQRHKCWGGYWASKGYFALLVDSYKPRGYPRAFQNDTDTHCCRPLSVSERDVRPLDAYDALQYLKDQCPDLKNDNKKHCSGVNSKKIGIQGWSNGGSTVMNALSKAIAVKEKNRFTAGLAFYPGCRDESDYKADGRPCECTQEQKANCSALFMGSILDPNEEWQSDDTPLVLLLAENDKEVKPKYCLRRLLLVEDGTQCTGKAGSCSYAKGATHGFDDPKNCEDKKSANCIATMNAKDLATKFFENYFKK